jgi:hypothetical protein
MMGSAQSVLRLLQATLALAVVVAWLHLSNHRTWSPYEDAPVVSGKLVGLVAMIAMFPFWYSMYRSWTRVCPTIMRAIILSLVYFAGFLVLIGPLTMVWPFEGRRWLIFIVTVPVAAAFERAIAWLSVVSDDLDRTNL